MLVSVFQAHQKSVLEKVESNERFALTCIALCRLTVVVTKAVRSPLSPLLGILNMVFLWFSSTGLLHLFDACCDTKDTSLSQLKLGARALRSEFGTLRNSFSDLLVCCGKEMFEAKQLRGIHTLRHCGFWFFSTSFILIYSAHLCVPALTAFLLSVF